MELDNPRGQFTVDKSAEKSPSICRFFRNGNCKHGMKGRDCKFTHPKVCRRFIQHGTRQPRGCNQGRKCKDFHPRMCISSLRKGECFSDSCRYNHVKGTKRQPPVGTNHMQEKLVHQKPATGTNIGFERNNQPGNFLDVIHLLKKEIMDMFNNKLEAIQTQVQQLQQVNLSQIYPQHPHQQLNTRMMLPPRNQPHFQLNPQNIQPLIHQ